MKGLIPRKQQTTSLSIPFDFIHHNAFHGGHQKLAILRAKPATFKT